MSEPIRKIICAGDRDWDQPELIKRCLQNCVHRFGPRLMILTNGHMGAEGMAVKAAVELTLNVHTYPPRFDVEGTSAMAALGRARQTMIDENPGIKRCLIFEENTHPGTRDLIYRCESAGIPWQVFRKEVIIRV